MPAVFSAGFFVSIRFQPKNEVTICTDSSMLSEQKFVANGSMGVYNYLVCYRIRKLFESCGFGNISYHINAQRF